VPGFASLPLFADTKIGDWVCARAVEVRIKVKVKAAKKIDIFVLEDLLIFPLC